MHIMHLVSDMTKRVIDVSVPKSPSLDETLFVTGRTTESGFFLDIFPQQVPTKSWRFLEFFENFLEFFEKFLEFSENFLEFFEKILEFFWKMWKK